MPIRTMAALIALLLALVPAQRADGDSRAQADAEVQKPYASECSCRTHTMPKSCIYAHAHMARLRSERTNRMRSEDGRAPVQPNSTAHASAAPESAAMPTGEAQHAKSPVARHTAAPTQRAQPAATVPYANIHPAHPTASPPPATNADYISSIPDDVINLPSSVPLDEFTPPEPGAFFAPEGDMGIAIGECWYPIMRDFSALREALGEPLDIVLTESGNHPGHYDKEYVYEFGSVYTHPKGDADIWYELFVYGDGITTSRGITNGSSLDDMLAAYGQEYYPDSAVTYIYTLSGREQDFASPAITFETSDDRVIYFDIFYPVYEN